MKKELYKRIGFVRTVCSMMVLLLVSFCILTPRLFPESSDTGADQARILYELGVFPKYDGVYLAEGATPEIAQTAIWKLLGSGDAKQTAAFYRYLNLETAPDLTVYDAQDALTETQGYALLLRALGHFAEDVAVLDKAKTVGFGFMRDVRDSQAALTNGTFAILLYEALFVRPPNTENYTTYRILGKLNSDFKEILLNNGLYDDIPEAYVPLFNRGIYKQDSFVSLPGTQGRREWVAHYLNVDSEYIASYIDGLLAGAWTLEGSYSVEGDTPAQMEVLYRSFPEDTQRELGLVLKYYSNGTVEWALLLP